MANRRMFSLDVVNTDKFMEMPLTAQALYFHLGMRADDDGFIASPRQIMKAVECKQDDMKILISKGYVIPFESGIVVIRHWKQHNYIQSDRYRKTKFLEERSHLELVENVYITDTERIQNGSNVEPQYRLSKDIVRVRVRDRDSIALGDTVCTEPEESVSMPPVISLILNDKSLHDIFQSDIDGWKELYPAVDILQELRKMKGWLDSNPAKRKTQRGIKRFINGWLAREQDRSGTTADRDGTDGAGIKRFISGKSNEELEKGIHDIVTSRISQEALDRYHDKIHELIRLCCPFEIFTQEQIDYMRREWKMEPLHKDSAFVVPREDIYDFYDRKLGVSKGIETN